MKITPLLKNTRVELNVKENDELPRGRWRRTLTIDMPNTEIHGKRIVVKGISCGLGGCYCDARITALK